LYTKAGQTKLVSSPNIFGYQCKCVALVFSAKKWAPPQKGLPADNACHAPAAFIGRRYIWQRLYISMANGCAFVWNFSGPVLPANYLQLRVGE